MKEEIILVADDDESDLYFLGLAVKKHFPDCAVVEVRDGEEAVDYLSGRGRYADRKAHPLPDHVFLDIKMPKLSGLEVLRWLRGQEAIAGLPVAVISGSSLPKDENEARSLGADYYVKPIDFVDLENIVLDYQRKHVPPGGPFNRTRA